MTKSKIGLVYYGTDHGKKVIRRIYPTLDDGEIDTELCQCKSNDGKGCGELAWIAHLDKTKNPTLKIVGRNEPQASASVITAA